MNKEGMAKLLIGWADEYGKYCHHHNPNGPLSCDFLEFMKTKYLEEPKSYLPSVPWLLGFLGVSLGGDIKIQPDD